MELLAEEDKQVDRVSTRGHIQSTLNSEHDQGCDPSSADPEA